MLEHTVDYGVVLVFAGSALPVVNHGITEINVVRAQNDGVVDEAVVHFGCVDFHSSLADQHVAFQIDTFERTEYAGPPRRSSVQTGEYAVCVVVQKSQVYVFGTNHQSRPPLGRRPIRMSPSTLVMLLWAGSACVRAGKLHFSPSPNRRASSFSPK